ncbi:MarR family winged helix-turn-helix transcriptional regulator [Spirosoma rigui]|uniref:MarR family winged helix-turn-helix transcriptional regulator n=1 Tax=Spirosoma rigui TaxID=564064 RepID=UPI0009AFC6B4|nr:MarR family transcriptional regulator [Spirosoma rigui]
MNKLRLDDQVCFPLYALSRQVTALYRPLLEKLNLTYPQYLVLLLLWETDSVTVSDIGERLRLDSGTLTPLLKRMEQKGLISRRRNPADERQVTILLTDAGRALEKQAMTVPVDLQTSLQLTDDQLVTLRDELKTLLNQLASIN